MGVVDVKEQRTGDAAGGSVEAKAATRVFTVLMDDPADSAVRAELAAGIPREGNPHPHDNWRRAKQPQTRRMGNSLLFEVTVPYETEPIPEGSDGTGNPISQPVEIEWSFELIEEAIDTDADGKAMQNSAEEPFDPPLTEKFATIVLTVSKNEPTFDPRVAGEYINSTNEDVWYSFPRGTCWMRGIRAPRIVSGNLVYYRVSFTVAIRLQYVMDGGIRTALGWQRRILDRGFRTIVNRTVAPPERYKNIVDKNKKKVTEPVLLDGKGGLLSDAFYDDVKVHLTFRTKPRADWSKLKVF